MAKKKKKKAKAKAKKSETLVKKSLVKEYITSQGDFRVSAESFDVLSDRIKDMCDDAIDRAAMNRRKTVQKQDF